MTQEEKNLLIVDLCGRLPYGVMVQDDIGRTYKLNLGNAYLADLCYGNGAYIETPIKPYLRPMSSITKKEQFELSVVPIYANMLDNASAQIDWLNAHHFDYRGLIEKGLAIDVTEDNNYYKY